MMIFGWWSVCRDLTVMRKETEVKWNELQQLKVNKMKEMEEMKRNDNKITEQTNDMSLTMDHDSTKL